jgi:hypothetical protein
MAGNRSRQQPHTKNRTETVLENIEDSDHLVEFVQYSPPPKVVFCHYGSYDCVGTIWWDYQVSQSDEVLSWEVRRYRLDVISKTYLQKGSQIYKDSIPRKVLACSCLSHRHISLFSSILSMGITISSQYRRSTPTVGLL